MTLSPNNISSAHRFERILLVQRIVLSIIIAAHGIARYWFDAVDPFGVWLGSQGFPLGNVIAYSITIIEIFGAIFLALGRFVLPLCLIYTTVYFLGLILVHAPEGWFVVGLGRNGMEYSVLLIVCLLGIGYQHLPNFSRRVNKQNDA